MRNYKVIGANEEIMKTAADTFFRQFVEWMNSESIESDGYLQEAAEVVRAEFVQKGDWYNALVESIAQYLRTIPANEGLYSVAEGLADRIVGAESDRDSIDNLDLTVRTYNCLKRAGVETVSQLRQMSAVDFANVKNFSQRCFEEVLEKLKNYKC